MTCMEDALFVQQSHLDGHHSCSSGRLVCKSHYPLIDETIHTKMILLGLLPSWTKPE